MEAFKKVINILAYALAFYLAIFLLWFIMIAGCLEHFREADSNNCGGDAMTQTIKRTHAPTIKLMMIRYEKR